MPFTVRELAQICGGIADGEMDRLISGADTLERATPSDLAFATNKTAFKAMENSNAGCLLMPLEYERLNKKQTIIRVKEPRTAFVLALSALYPRKTFGGFLHPTAVIAETAKITADSYIGPHAVIGDRSEIAAGSYVGSGCSIGSQVRIGPGSVIHPNVSIYDGVRIGARAIVHSGCVIGADGFGFTLTGDHYEKFPQVGAVEIGDDVEIGANCCIDRAALGVTHIGNGVKLDNLVHVGHNCTIGNHVVIAAQTGFSGSVTVGDYAVIGGQVGIGEKAHIDARAIVGGKAGILTSQRVHAGEPVWGIPARPLRKHLKNLAYVSKLPELKEQLNELRQQIATFETAQQRTKL